jgi:hypothetical protein
VTGRVRVESDGTPIGTFVTVDGTLVQGVRTAKVDLDAVNGAIVTIVLDDIDLDIRNDDQDEPTRRPHVPRFAVGVKVSACDVLHTGDRCPGRCRMLPPDDPPPHPYRSKIGDAVCRDCGRPNEIHP